MTKPLSLMQWTEGSGGAELVANAQRLEEMGYHELWVPEIFGREPLATCGYLLAKTTKLRVSTGIINVYVRDADAAAQGANTLSEFSDGRFTLGLGVSHPVLVEPRGHDWEMPVPKMRAYLERLAVAPIESPRAQRRAPVIVAGHGPKLMALAAAKADGSFLFLQTTETVKQARAVLGPTKELHVAVRCVLDPNPDTARDLARRACAFYMGLPAYHRVWTALGYEPADWENGSERLIDAIVAWGDAARIRARLDEYYAAGATHVVLYPCNPDETYTPESAVSKNWNWPIFEALAPG